MLGLGNQWAVTARRLRATGQRQQGGEYKQAAQQIVFPHGRHDNYLISAAKCNQPQEKPMRH